MKRFFSATEVRNTPVDPSNLSPVWNCEIKPFGSPEVAATPDTAVLTGAVVVPPTSKKAPESRSGFFRRVRLASTQNTRAHVRESHSDPAFGAPKDCPRMRSRMLGSGITKVAFWDAYQQRRTPSCVGSSRRSERRICIKREKPIARRRRSRTVSSCASDARVAFG